MTMATASVDVTVTIERYCMHGVNITVTMVTHTVHVTVTMDAHAVDVTATMVTHALMQLQP